MQIFAQKTSKLNKFVCRFIVRIKKSGLFRVIKHYLASEFVNVLFKKHKIIINFSKKKTPGACLYYTYFKACNTLDYNLRTYRESYMLLGGQHVQKIHIFKSGK